MSSNENLDLQLSKGSQWMRRDGSQVKFLFLTNTSLSPRTQEKHPPRVIYADVNGDVYDRTVAEFLKIYQFYNVDGELEQRLNRLIVFNPEDYATIQDDDEVIQITDSDEDDEDTDSIIPEAPKADETLAEQMLRELTASAGEETHLSVTFAVSRHEGLRQPKLTAEDLAQAVVLYSNEPNDHFNITEHKLLFPLGGPITEESLREIFHPSTEVNTVDYFTVTTKYRRDEIVWSSWIGIVPEYSVNGLYAAVLVGTDNVTLDKAPTPGVDEVVVPGIEQQQQQAAQTTNEFDPAAILAHAAQAAAIEAATAAPVEAPQQQQQVEPVTPVPVSAPVVESQPPIQPVVVQQPIQPAVVQVMATL